jgi:uncharacterized protein (UPF0332 family)
MSYPEGLIDLAVDLVLQKAPTQAYFRRAVSTAYYALFHELTQAAVNEWKIERHRSGLVRTIEHRRVKFVCDEVGKDRASPDDLKKVAESFVQLQQDRHSADYDLTRVWSETEAYTCVQTASKALSAWAEVQEHPAAEDFLTRILFPKDPSR